MHGCKNLENIPEGFGYSYMVRTSNHQCTLYLNTSNALPIYRPLDNSPVSWLNTRINRCRFLRSPNSFGIAPAKRRMPLGHTHVMTILTGGKYLGNKLKKMYFPTIDRCRLSGLLVDGFVWLRGRLKLRFSKRPKTVQDRLQRLGIITNTACHVETPFPDPRAHPSWIGTQGVSRDITEDSQIISLSMECITGVYPFA